MLNSTLCSIKCLEQYSPHTIFTNNLIRYNRLHVFKFFTDQVSFRKTSMDQKIQSKDYRANLANPRERLEESSIIPNHPRPPQTGVYFGEFQLCKW